MKADAILISGVGKRIGLHLSRHFLQRGYSVIGTYRTEYDSLEELKQEGADLYSCDFNSSTQLQNLIESVASGYSSLRALIHNASDWLPDKCGLSAEDTMDKMIRVHVSAPYQLNLAFSDLLTATSNAYADIVHIGDFVSTKGSKKHIAYAASKAAQDNLTLSFAASLAPKVKVNSLAPALAMFKDDDNEEYRQRTLQKNLLQREGGLEEVRHAIDYLLDSSFVTGRILPMDGGRHLCSDYKVLPI